MRKYLFIPCLIIACFVSVGVFGQKKTPPTSIITGTFVGISPALRDIPVAQPTNQTTSPRSFGEHDEANMPVKHNVYNPNAVYTDGALQTFGNRRINPPGSDAPVITFDGNISTQGYLPPDICQSTGPNHVVQMTNTMYAVYNKTGTRLAGPALFSAIATGADNSGDPVVLYDHLADRWLLMQFS